MTVTGPPDDIVIDRDAEVATRDGTVLRVNVFRAADEGPRPVIVSAHPYGKDNLPARRGNRWTYSPQYHMLRQPAPVAFSALTGWEAPDPVWWVEQGFAVVNADLRGCGHSDGVAKLLSQQESEDVYDIVQWAAGQTWSDGRVVMLGVSYLAISQYGRRGAYATGASRHLPVGRFHRRVPGSRRIPAVSASRASCGSGR